jgi:NodT family efflux transporter outer membrane factor (OMF) lipoprotein
LSGPPLPALSAPRASLLACTLLLTGCEVGPDFHPPAAPVDAGYTAAALPARIAGAPIAAGDDQALRVGQDISGQWWTLFRSPELTALIDQALRHNPSLAAAQATLLQARETARVQQGGLFPAIAAAFGVTHEQTSAASFGPVGAAEGGVPTGPYDLFNATINVSYTLDVWGGIRRGVEQAQAQAEYQRYVLEATYLTLTSNIVAAAVAEASLRAQIAETEKVVTAEQEGLRIIQAQLDAGAVTRAEVLQQQAQLQTTLATLPPLRSQLAQERNLLASYVGAFPNQFAEPVFLLATLQLPTALPVSLPSALVAQRPDIREGEAQLHALTAAVGVATSNMLPQVALTGSVGSQALKLGSLFSGGTLAYSLAAQATQAVFQGGALVHQRRAAVAAMQAAAANYQATVLNAFANVADALQALEYDATALQVARDAADSASASLGLLQVQFKAGAVNYLSVLTAQQTAQTALVTLARAQAARYADTVALFAALGGGWWNRADVDPKVARCCAVFE